MGCETTLAASRKGYIGKMPEGRRWRSSLFYSHRKQPQTNFNFELWRVPLTFYPSALADDQDSQFL